MKKLSGAESGTWRSWRKTARHFIDRFRELAVLGEHDQHVLLRRREQLVHGEVREHDAAVVLARKRRGRALHHADHLQLGAGYADGFPEWLLLSEQGLVDVFANDGDRHVMLIFGFREEAAFQHFGLPAIRVARSRAIHLRPEVVVAFVADAAGEVAHASHATREQVARYVRSTAGHRSAIAIGLFVGQRLAIAFFRRCGRRNRAHAHLEHDRGIGSHAADHAGDRAVEAGQNRADAR